MSPLSVLYPEILSDCDIPCYALCVQIGGRITIVNNPHLFGTTPHHERDLVVQVAIDQLEKYLQPDPRAGRPVADVIDLTTERARRRLAKRIHADLADLAGAARP